MFNACFDAVTSDIEKKNSINIHDELTSNKIVFDELGPSRSGGHFSFYCFVFLLLLFLVLTFDHSSLCSSMKEQPATTFACKSQECCYAGLVYFFLSSCVVNTHQTLTVHTWSY